MGGRGGETQVLGKPCISSPRKYSQSFSRGFHPDPKQEFLLLPSENALLELSPKESQWFCLVWAAVRACLELLSFQKWLNYFFKIFFCIFSGVRMSLFKAWTPPESVTQCKMCGFKRIQFFLRESWLCCSAPWIWGFSLDMVNSCPWQILSGLQPLLGGLMEDLTTKWKSCSFWKRKAESGRGTTARAGK